LPFADTSSILRCGDNSTTMLMSFNIRRYLPEAARAASALPCWHMTVKVSNQLGDQPALAHQPMR
jgi:hypothetical protein